MLYFVAAIFVVISFGVAIRGINRARRSGTAPQADAVKGRGRE